MEEEEEKPMICRVDQKLVEEGEPQRQKSRQENKKKD